MPDILPLPRKRRTRSHIIADQSVNFIERFVLKAGNTVDRLVHDYGYDLLMMTYDSQGYVESGHAIFQIKASDQLRETNSAKEIAVRLSAADLNRWLHEMSPVFLLVYDAPRDRMYWLYVQRHFANDPSRREFKGVKSVVVRIPKRNRVNANFIAFARTCKENIMRQKRGIIDHA